MPTAYLGCSRFRKAYACRFLTWIPGFAAPSMGPALQDLVSGSAVRLIGRVHDDVNRAHRTAMKTTLLCSALLFLFFVTRAIAGDHAPATVFDLQQWKLQIPGPKEIKTLKNYSSTYFRLNAEKEMCLHLDTAEKGTTPNTHYVRSELRHLPEWDVK